jgi:hypothetical protein
MATANERIGVLETRVDNLDTKLDDIKSDVKEVHDCLHRTGEDLKEQLEKTAIIRDRQHIDLASKISELEKFKNKWTYMVLGGIAVFGWVSGHMNAIANLLK